MLLLAATGLSTPLDGVGELYGAFVAGFDPAAVRRPIFYVSSDARRGSCRQGGGRLKSLPFASLPLRPHFRAAGALPEQELQILALQALHQRCVFGEQRVGELTLLAL